MPNANRDKGLRSERQVANYFQSAGMDSAWRSVATGHKYLTDRGDLQGTPGICVQVKNLSKPLTELALINALKETAEQAVASHQIIGLLIEKRQQCADVGKWYAWLRAEDYVCLVAGLSPETVRLMIGPSYPIRVELRHVMDQIMLFSKLAKEVGYR